MNQTIRRIETALALVGLLGAIALGAWVGFTLTEAGAQVQLTSTPHSASVEVDGRFCGTTPLTLDDLAPGAHFVRLTKFGFRPRLEEVTVKPGRNDLEFSLDARPRGSIEIVSSPPGARVYVDGKQRGFTPLTVADLLPGEHEMRLDAVNYFDHIQRFDIPDEGEAEPLNVTLSMRTEEFYLEKIEADPKAAEPRTDLAHYYILQKEWKKAEDRFAEALYLIANESSSSGYGWRLLAELRKVMQEQFEYGDAEDVKKGRTAVINALERAMEESPKYIRNFDYGINFALWAGDTERAGRLMEKAILAYPSQRDWLKRAGSPWGQRDIDKLERTFERQVKKNPKDFARRYMLYTHDLRRKTREQSDAELQDLCGMAVDPRVAAMLWEDLGREREKRKELDKAVEAYRQAVKLQPDPKKRAPIQYNLIRALTLLKKTDELPDAWKLAVELQPNDGVAERWRLSWAEACIDAKKKDEARRILQDLLKRDISQNTRQKAEKLLKQS